MPDINTNPAPMACTLASVFPYCLHYMISVFREKKKIVKKEMLSVLFPISAPLSREKINCTLLL